MINVLQSLPRSASVKCSVFWHVFIVALVSILPLSGQAKGLNAWHYSTRDDLTGIGDAVIVGSNTRYTPDLSLTHVTPTGPDSGTQRLLNATLDEIFLQITFKPGITPNINKLVEIRYGTEFVFTPGAQPLFSRVVGQDLLVWYGFQDYPNFGAPIVTTDSDWTFTITGDHPVAQVQFFISSHQNGALEMPDLQPFNNLLYVDPEKVSALYTEQPGNWAQGKPYCGHRRDPRSIHRAQFGSLGRTASCGLLEAEPAWHSDSNYGA